MKQPNIAAPTTDIEQRIAERFQQISDRYDFSGFTLPGFIAWTEKERGKSIKMTPWAMPATIFGAWMEAEDIDYIFYYGDAIPLHKAHIQLHELAHMLCGHETIRVTNEALASILMDEFSAANLLLRSTKSNQEEQEAELLTSLIQEQLHRHARFHELTAAATADEEQNKLLVALEMLD